MATGALGHQQEGINLLRTGRTVGDAFMHSSSLSRFPFRNKGIPLRSLGESLLAGVCSLSLAYLKSSVYMAHSIRQHKIKRLEVSN